MRPRSEKNYYRFSVGEVLRRLRGILERTLDVEVAKPTSLGVSVSLPMGQHRRLLETVIAAKDVEAP